MKSSYCFLSFVVILLLLAFCSVNEAKQPPRKLLSQSEAEALGVGLTPFGYLPKHCIHSAEENVEIIEEKDAIIMKDRNGKETKRIVGKCDRSGVAPLPSGWSVYAAWIDKNPLEYFGAAWTVPPVPSDEGTQVLFLFNGLQNDGPLFVSDGTGEEAVTTIIQPVLQFGVSDAGGGKYWAIASWFVSSSGHTVYSKLTTVSSGDLLLGNMTNNAGLWQIVTLDTTSGESVEISVRPGAAQLFAAITLEVYQVTSCLEYPQGTTTFFDIDLKDSTGVAIPSWTPNTLRGCSEAISIQDSNLIQIKW